MYTTPTIAGTTITFTMAPDMGSGNVADNAYSGDGGSTGAGHDITVNINPSLGTEILTGLNLFVGAHQTVNTVSTENNLYEGVGGLTFDIGPVSLGYAASGVSTGQEGASEVDWYKNSMYGVAFNINDDLSVSYGFHKSRKGFVKPGSYESVELDMESWQIAYSIGGASVRFADTDVTNGAYQTTAGYDKGAQVLSVSLAF